LQAACANGHIADSLQIGISPHAPYTVEPEAMRRCAREAARLGLPICIHLAESREELEFTQTGRGPLREFLQSIGVWDQHISVPGCSPIRLAHDTGLLSPRTIIAHANYVDDEDIALIAKSGASVAYCPCTHAAFDHPPHRFMDMQAAGINVCIGTDSLASNPTLSVLEELRCVARRWPDTAADQLLKLATISGASALGMSRLAGSFSAGRKMDAVVIALKNTPLDSLGRILDAESDGLEVFTDGRANSNECQSSSRGPKSAMKD
jgi:cytosine/adenosine deaminase-related metal-dependent hydrolase